MTEYTLHPSEGPLNLGSLMQHKMSYLLFSCRLESSDKSATNTVIWSKKSKRTATAAYKENTLTAGMVDSAPVNKRWKERKLKWNRSRNWVILIFSGQKPCTRIVQIISHSLLHFSRAIDVISYPLWHQRPIFMGGHENKCQSLQEWWKHKQNSENFMCKMSLCESWHLLSHTLIRNILWCLLSQIANYIDSPWKI